MEVILFIVVVVLTVGYTIAKDKEDRIKKDLYREYLEKKRYEELKKRFGDGNQ